MINKNYLQRRIKMSSNAKKGLIIAGLICDVLVTVGLFILSIYLITKIPDAVNDVSAETFYGWFMIKPTRILLIVVLPLALLLGLNVFVTIKFMKSGSDKKKVTIDDLSDDDKEALKKKILEELASESKENK